MLNNKGWFPQIIATNRYRYNFSATLVTLLLILGLLASATTNTFAQDKDTGITNTIYVPIVSAGPSTDAVEAITVDEELPDLDGEDDTDDELQSAARKTKRLALYPTDDTFANRYDPTTPRGDKLILRINGDNTRTKQIYLRFDGNSLPPGAVVTKAILKLGSQTTARFKIAAFDVPNDSWSESTLTWANRPSANSTALATISKTKAGAYVKFDVTAAINGPGLYSFQIAPLSTQNLDISFDSKEGTDKKPKLTITYTYTSCVQGQVNAKLVPQCGALLGGWRNRAASTWSDQIAAHERLIAPRQLDVIRNFHSPTSHYQALTSDEKDLIKVGRHLLIGYRPAANWHDAGGGNATINQEITNFAKSVKGVAPHKVMLIIEHEPEKRVGSAGTTADYVNVWRNVRRIFDNVGVTNVIWVWDVQNTSFNNLRDHLAPLWPGNKYVDWVMWNPYVGSNNEQIVDVIQEGYDWLTDNSNSTHNYLSKPWGLGEWGIGVNGYIPSAANQKAQFITLSNTLNQQSNPFPKLKLLAVFDERESEIQGAAEAAYQEFANSPYLTQLR